MLSRGPGTGFLIVKTLRGWLGQRCGIPRIPLDNSIKTTIYIQLRISHFFQRTLDHVQESIERLTQPEGL